MNTTMCRITINPEINEIDRKLLARSLAKFHTVGESDIREGVVEIVVEADDWSTLCILEDFDILIAEQI